jgi:hypothetical protein
LYSIRWFPSPPLKKSRVTDNLSLCAGKQAPLLRRAALVYRKSAYEKVLAKLPNLTGEVLVAIASDRSLGFFEKNRLPNEKERDGFRHPLLCVLCVLCG